MRCALILVLLLAGCAGKVAGNPAWTQTNATTWEYGFAVGPLLGRVVLLNDEYNAYGCNNKNELNLATLATAETFVETSCANANQVKK